MANLTGTVVDERARRDDLAPSGFMAGLSRPLSLKMGSELCSFIQIPLPLVGWLASWLEPFLTEIAWNPNLVSQKIPSKSKLTQLLCHGHSFWAGFGRW